MCEQEASKIARRPWSRLSIQPAEEAMVVRVWRLRQFESSKKLAHSIEEWEVMAWMEVVLFEGQHEFQTNRSLVWMAYQGKEGLWWRCNKASSRCETKSGG
jgi:hypothetical protein